MWMNQGVAIALTVLLGGVFVVGIIARVLCWLEDNFGDVGVICAIAIFAILVFMWSVGSLIWGR